MRTLYLKYSENINKKINLPIKKDYKVLDFTIFNDGTGIIYGITNDFIAEKICDVNNTLKATELIKFFEDNYYDWYGSWRVLWPENV